MITFGLETLRFCGWLRRPLSMSSVFLRTMELIPNTHVHRLCSDLLKSKRNYLFSSTLSQCQCISASLYDRHCHYYLLQMKLGPLILILVLPRRLGVDQHLGIENQKWKVTIIFAILLADYESFTCFSLVPIRR